MSEHAAPTAADPTPEDVARAAFYALLARLFTTGPDAALLAAIAAADPLSVARASGERTDEGADGLAAAWDALRAASAASDPDAIRQEYDDLFVGVGKSEVNLHASHWLTGFMMEKPLAELRSALADLGLGRRADALLVEDHLAAVFETMRILAGGSESVPPASFVVQKTFFERHVLPWTFRCLDEIVMSPLAIYYRAVAQFANKFVAIERDAFAID
jgi:TorA maturation chaperone TorD